MGFLEQGVDPPTPRPDDHRREAIAIGTALKTDVHALKNDLAVALLALEALSADPTLGEEQRRLAAVGLARLLRAAERLTATGHAERLDHAD